MRRILTLLTLIFSLSLFSAQPAFASPQADVTDDQATLSFPIAVTFSAQITATSNITSVVLEYGTDQLTWRQGLVEAKSRLVQAKAHLADRNFCDAARELGQAVGAVETITKGAKSDDTTNALRDMAGSLREVKLEIEMGKPVSLKKLDELQQRMDQLLNK